MEFDIDHGRDFGLVSIIHPRATTVRGIRMVDLDGRPKFPGAKTSPVSSTMDFVTPQRLPPIATYRVLDVEGKMVDANRPAPDISHDQALEWYRNMVTGEFLAFESRLG
jgi:hypothetical protein